jgi:diguanylate cyclase (GGDEF)-like protein
MNQRHIPPLEIINAAATAAGGIAALILASFLDPRGLPSGWVMAGFTALAALTMAMGFPAPRVGSVALDRVSQIAMILIFGPFAAALITALASFIWPFIGCYKKDFSPRRALLRGVHNAGMLPIVVLAGAGVYSAMGGEMPLTHLNAPVIGKLIAMVLVMQIANDLMMGLLTLIRGAGPLASIVDFADLMELAMAPLGVFTALVYNGLALGSFLLLVLVLLLLALLMRTFAINRTDLERRIERMAAITELSQASNASIALAELAETTFAQCRRLLAFSAFHLALYDEAAGELDFVLHVSRGERKARRRVPAGQGLLGWVVGHNQPVLIRNWATDRQAIKRQAVLIGEQAAAWLGVPVTYRDEVLGAICVQNFVPNTLNEADLELMRTFAGQVGAAIANARLFGELEDYKRELEYKVAERTESLHQANEAKARLLMELEGQTEELDRLAKVDDLTGLYNRRFMDQRLATEIERAERYGHGITIAMADLDHFKRINDDHSHAVGDEVLRVAGRLLKEACRATDIVSRYGGEEFIICFPETDIDGARRVCERIRSAFAECDWAAIAPKLNVTLSIGVAGGFCYERDRLHRLADAMLYQAKDLGRDRICA